MTRLFGRRPEPGRDELPPGAEDDARAGSPPAHVQSASGLRKELRMLVERRELDLRDLGGLTLEMVRRERLKPELLEERAADVLALEERIRELDLLLDPARAPSRGGPRCVCGNPLPAGARFCWRCGRPAPHAMPLVPCRRCRAALPADASFCPSCGTPTSVARPASPGAAGADETASIPADEAS